MDCRSLSRVDESAERPCCSWSLGTFKLLRLLPPCAALLCCAVCRVLDAAWRCLGRECNGCDCVVDVMLELCVCVALGGSCDVASPFADGTRFPVFRTSTAWKYLHTPVSIKSMLVWLNRKCSKSEIPMTVPQDDAMTSKQRRHDKLAHAVVLCLPVLGNSCVHSFDTES